MKRLNVATAVLRLTVNPISVGLVEKNSEVRLARIAKNRLISKIYSAVIAEHRRRGEDEIDVAGGCAVGMCSSGFGLEFGDPCPAIQGDPRREC